jgi:hypothetical protein
MYTAKQFESALAATLAKVRSDVVQAWADAPTLEKREELWLEQKAIDRVEECIRNDFASIIERAAGGPE